MNDVWLQMTSAEFADYGRAARGSVERLIYDTAVGGFWLDRSGLATYDVLLTDERLAEYKRKYQTTLYVWGFDSGEPDERSTGKSEDLISVMSIDASGKIPTAESPNWAHEFWGMTKRRNPTASRVKELK